MFLRTHTGICVVVIRNHLTDVRCINSTIKVPGAGSRQRILHRAVSREVRTKDFTAPLALRLIGQDVQHALSPAPCFQERSSSRAKNLQQGRFCGPLVEWHPEKEAIHLNDKPTGNCSRNIVRQTRLEQSATGGSHKPPQGTMQTQQARFLGEEPARRTL